jgi:hypothetical protein
MISILIPTYNYNIFPLVKLLNLQIQEAKIPFEIICLDDCSQQFHSENQVINTLENCSYSILQKNIGRSAIRNLLALKANFNNLLFLDADVMPINQDFISNYLKHCNSTEQVVYGGIQYQKEKPTKNQVLRWVYGNSREALCVTERNKNPYLNFLTLNFLISKSVFEKVKFNENIPNLRHEDTLFSYDVMKNNIQMIHIENPVCHFGLESSAIFLKKSEEAVLNLHYLIENNLLSAEYARISKVFTRIKKLHLQGIFSFIHKVTKPVIIKNLYSNSPSLLLFDWYRLGYLCGLKTK